MEQDYEQVNINQNDTDSDASSIVLEQKERKLLRQDKILRRRNIIDIENEVNQKKLHEKMIIPYPVAEKIKNLNEYELGCMLEESIKFIEERCLVFDQNERERELVNHDIYESRLFKIKDTLNKINNLFMEINDRCEETNKKTDFLIMHKDIIELKKQSLDLLKQKDDIIDEMVDELEKLVTKSLDETLANNNDINKLNTIAKHKIQTIKEEYERNNLFITELIEDETNKRDTKDDTEWTYLIDKTINKISSSTLKRLALIQQKDSELGRQCEANIEKIDTNVLNSTEKYIGMENDLEFVKLKCAENINKIKLNCSILKRRIEDNTYIINIQKKRLSSLQNLASKINEKHKQMEAYNKTQILMIKKEIININKRIDEKEKQSDTSRKKNNWVYTQTWNLLQNEIIRYINNILQIDDFIYNYLDIEKEPFSKIPNISVLPFMKITNHFIFNKSSNENLALNSYERARDEALNKLVVDFIVNNSSIVFDYNLNRIIETEVNSMQNLPYVFSILNLNDIESWTIMKSKFKPYVMCIVCNSPVNWDSYENKESLVNELKHCTISNSGINESMKYLSEMYSTHIAQHNENIEKVIIKSNNLNDTIYSNINIEEQNNKLSITEDNKKCNQCININHQLHLDDKYCMPIIKEIIKEKQNKPHLKPKSLKLQEDNCMQWNISKNDLREYWTTFSKYIPKNTIDLWDILYKQIGPYYNDLNECKKKIATLKTLQQENVKLKQIKQELQYALLKV